MFLNRESSEKSTGITSKTIRYTVITLGKGTVVVEPVPGDAEAVSNARSWYNQFAKAVGQKKTKIVPSLIAFEVMGLSIDCDGVEVPIAK